MITIRRGSRVYKLLAFLATVGEYPMQSLQYLGSADGWRKLISTLCATQDYRIPGVDKTFTGRLLHIAGANEYRGVYLYKGGLPILKQAIPEAYDYYVSRFPNYFHSARLREVERVHRMAEVTAICERADIQSCQYKLPVLQNRLRQKMDLPSPSFFSSWEIKNADEDGGNRTKFSRLAGAIIYPGGCYAVYHGRGSVMNWQGQGEMKTKLYLSELCRMNTEIQGVKRAILFGDDYQLAERTFHYLDDMKKSDTSFDQIFPHLHFIPTTDFGIRLLKVLTLPDWNERLLELLFDFEDRSFNKSSIECDAIEDGVFVYSFLDSDIIRLSRFRSMLKEDSTKKFEFVCFREQGHLLRSIFGSKIKLRFIDLKEVEDELHTDWSDQDE